MTPTRTLKRIGVLFGLENSFPGALVEEINQRNVAGVRAGFVELGPAALPHQIATANPEPRYNVLIDRIAHRVPFYRAWLKAAVLEGSVVMNNPFWQSVDDKFLNYALARRLGLAVPATVLLPHREPPSQLTPRSLRNLEVPLNWDRVFDEVGTHGYLKPIDGGGWRDVHFVQSRAEFFAAYEQTRDLCMVYQRAIRWDAYFRCYVVGGSKVRVMAYDPLRPHAERYRVENSSTPRALIHRMEREAALVTEALGYDFNTVEFALAAGVPYAIDFMNPVPDADPASVGEANARWFVEQVADLAIERALDRAQERAQAPALRASALLGMPERATRPTRRKARKRTRTGVLAKLPPL